MSLPPHATSRLLAFDSSTDALSVGVRLGEQLWLHRGPGGAQASITLIACVLDLLRQAGLGLKDLEAIVFGRGPGSFTGLRTACAVAQGLAAGSGRPVLPIDTLLAVAEEGRRARPEARYISAVLDARMDQVYVQHFSVQGEQLQALQPGRVCAPEAIDWPENEHAHVAAGNAQGAYGERLRPLPTGSAWLHALPTAEALLGLAPTRLACAVPAEQAQPLYIRDKVALTTQERAAAKASSAPHP
jgi:tRNA threonylcarbamoyladenosine biosynthesis protein TsaB